MRRLLLCSLGLVGALYLLPAFWQGGGAEQAAPLPIPEAASAAAAPPTLPQTDTVTVEIDGKPVSLPLERYVEGVVAAEIPDSFPTAALRAQAVAARTYAVYKLTRGRPDAHPNADLCDDFRHCAAYRDPVQAASADGGISNVQKAVRDTAGEILTCDGAPIAAVFHCVSGPRTEAAADVWGEDIPYLQSEVSPGGSACSEYEDAVTLPLDEFRRIVQTAWPAADLSGAPEGWFRSSDRSAAGGVRSVQLGGVTVKGGDVREQFGLHSTNFTVDADADSITFHTIGYGHGVGLSQYGAKYLAEQGEDYAAILARYYRGTALTALDG